MPINIVLVDDHALVRDGIKSLLEYEGDIQVVGEADDGPQGITVVKESRPDLLIIDIRMPKMSGIETIRSLKASGDSTPCLMLSMHDSEEYVLQSIQAGADGYLLKDASREEFLKAIHTIHSGERYFSGDLSHILVKQIVGGGGAPLVPAAAPRIKISRRQRQILEHVMRGETNQEIAEALNLGRRTVETHRYKLMEKLEVNNRGDLLRRAKELGLI